MQPAQDLVYREPQRCRQRRPVWRARWLWERATLPASFCFRDPRLFAGCIAPTGAPTLPRDHTGFFGCSRIPLFMLWAAVLQKN